MIKRRLAIFLFLIMCLLGCHEKAEVENTVAGKEEITTEVTTEESDTTSPVIELASDGVAYYEGDKYDPMSYVVSVTDDSGELIKAEYDDTDVNIASPGDYVISYSATDSAGNSSEKELNFKVKKEYSRDEIKEIIQELINEKYYVFDLEDERTYEDGEITMDGIIYGTLNIYANFEDNVTNTPDTYWGTDTNVYTTVTLKIHINDENYGNKNANTNTLNSELVINVYDESGETKLCNAESIDISSDKGRLSISSIYEGTCSFNQDGYFKFARTHFCFDNEKQIEKFKEILDATNVSIKIHKENGENTSFILNKNQCANWLKVISFYEDLNEYVNNIPNK